MITSRKNYRAVLKQELKRRQMLNPRYSLRAFARQLGLTPSRLSEVLNGRYGLSRSSAEEVARHLGYSSQQSEVFCDLVEKEHGRSATRRNEAERRIRSLRKAERGLPETQVVSLEVDEEISLWGKADYQAVHRFLSKRGAVPYRAPELGGAASVAWVIKRSRVTGGAEGAQSHESYGLILVADAVSTVGYSIYVFSGQTDSPEMVALRKSLFEEAPRLCGKIRMEGDCEVEDESGRAFVRFKVGRMPELKWKRGKRFTLFRNGKDKDGRVARMRVTGVTHVIRKPFRPRTDSFWVREGCPLEKFLRRISFTPFEWNFSRSRFNYFKV